MDQELRRTPRVFCPSRDIFILPPTSYLPQQMISNAEFVNLSGLKTGVQTRAAWIQARTGIESRHWAKADESCSDLATRAAEQLFMNHPDFKNEIRHLVLATMSGDYPSPPTSPFVQNKLGLHGCATYDIGAACAGFVTGLQVSATMVLSNQEDVLLVASEIRSKFLDLADYNTSPLFGDGAAATGVSLNKKKGPQFLLKGIRVLTDGRYAELIMIPGGGSAKELVPSKNGRHYLTMRDGAAIFLKAREAFGQGSLEFLNQMGQELKNIKFLVPHQANSLILREVKKDLSLRDDQVIEIVAQTGNTSGASVGIALAHLCRQRRLNSGDLVLLAAAGGGGILAHALLEYRE